MPCPAVSFKKRFYCIYIYIYIYIYDEEFSQLYDKCVARSARQLYIYTSLLLTIYRIAGKFGGKYIWRFGLQPLKLNIGGI